MNFILRPFCSSQGFGIPSGKPQKPSCPGSLGGRKRVRNKWVLGALGGRGTLQRIGAGLSRPGGMVAGIYGGYVRGRDCGGL